LITALSPHRGQKIEIVAMAGDNETIQFARDFAGVFSEAGWIDVVGGVAQAFIEGSGAVDIEITLNQAEVQAGRMPNALKPLVNALTNLGLLAPATAGAPNVFMNPQSATDRISFRIGTKPPLSP
jgi:hypothetical protein